MTAALLDVSRRVRCSLILVVLVISGAGRLLAQSGPVITLAVDATEAPEKVIERGWSCPREVDR